VFVVLNLCLVLLCVFFWWVYARFVRVYAHLEDRKRSDCAFSFSFAKHSLAAVMLTQI
jgi:hypothetical protein